MWVVEDYLDENPAVLEKVSRSFEADGAHVKSAMPTMVKEYPDLASFFSDREGNVADLVSYQAADFSSQIYLDLGVVETNSDGLEVSLNEVRADWIEYFYRLFDIETESAGSESRDVDFKLPEDVNTEDLNEQWEQQATGDRLYDGEEENDLDEEDL